MNKLLNILLDISWILYSRPLNLDINRLISAFVAFRSNFPITKTCLDDHYVVFEAAEVKDNTPNLRQKILDTLSQHKESLYTLILLLGPSLKCDTDEIYGTILTILIRWCTCMKITFLLYISHYRPKLIHITWVLCSRCHCALHDMLPK